MINYILLSVLEPIHIRPFAGVLLMNILIILRIIKKEFCWDILVEGVDYITLCMVMEEANLIIYSIETNDQFGMQILLTNSASRRQVKN